MTLTSNPGLKAAEYRYFTVDLLTDEILAEIPFGGVTYGRALKSAGGFSGRIPVTDAPENRSLNLYETTMPGNTGLYVLRNGICVWGGIIWSRQYDIVSRSLEVSASEFTSYFHHRRIWRSWSHQTGATLSVDKANTFIPGRLSLAQDSTLLVEKNSTVLLEFYEPEDFKYNGYYRVDARSSAYFATNELSINPLGSVAEIVSFERKSGVVTVETKGAHKFQPGDSITVTLPERPELNTSAVIATLGYADSNVFSYTQAGADVARLTISGEAFRPLVATERRVFSNVTVSTRTDTYDYVRALVSRVFDDFTGVEFANEYIEPGLSTEIDVVRKKTVDGIATVTTLTDHGVAPGQTIYLRNLGAIYDGEREVLDTPSSTSFRFRNSGTENEVVVSPLVVNIIARSAANNVATMETDAPHQFSVGNRVLIDGGVSVDLVEDIFSGSQIITSVPTPKTFTYTIASPKVVPRTELSQSIASSNGSSRAVYSLGKNNGVVTVKTVVPHGFSANQQVTLSGIVPKIPVLEKAYSAETQRATVRLGPSKVPYKLGANDNFTIVGSIDTFSGTLKASPEYQTGNTRSFTLTTSLPHTFSVGDKFQLSGALDQIRPDKYSVANNTVTLSYFGVESVFGVGQSITISDARIKARIQSLIFKNGKVTLTFPSNNTTPFRVNDSLNISRVVTTQRIVSKSASDGLATLTTENPHNIREGAKVVISGVGVPFDGEKTILSATTSRIIYEIDSKEPFLPTASPTGSLKNYDPIFNGTHVATEVGPNTVSYLIDGNDEPNITLVLNDPDAPIDQENQYTSDDPFAGVFTVSPIVGSFVITEVGTISGTNKYLRFTLNTPNATDVSLYNKLGFGAVAVTPSFINGSRTVQKVTRNSITFSGTSTTPDSANSVNLDKWGWSTLVSVSKDSIFNGTNKAWSASYTQSGQTVEFYFYNSSGAVISYPNSLAETAVADSTYLIASSAYSGTATIAQIVDSRTFTYSTSDSNSYYAESDDLPRYGSASVSPVVLVNTYGPYPGNANIKIDFSSRQLSGTNIPPTPYRGFEVTNVGEALDKYSDTIDGFEYRIDCTFDAEANKFKREFVFVPINFPNPPAPGDSSPISRFGADKLVFEYPGSISGMSLDESAENSATRFFAIGENDLGPDAGPPFSVAAATDLLGGVHGGRKWPLLDDDEKVDDINDETVLYAYARRFLSESSPPLAKISVSVNGSLNPEIGSYQVGDWCSLIVNDEFVLQRLRSDMEPRDTVLVRKINAYKVSVPDGTTFPEKVDLELVAEWEVDTRG